MLKSIKIRILAIFIIFLILIVVICIYKFRASFLTKEERLQKFRPSTAITGLLGSDGKALFKGESIEKDSFDYFKN
jgi:Na+/H+ antiporter NhaC